MASQYGVSAETARRSICVLADLDIVSSVKGSGVTIKAYENAEKFISQQKKRQSIKYGSRHCLHCLPLVGNCTENPGAHLALLRGGGSCLPRRYPARISDRQSQDAFRRRDLLVDGGGDVREAATQMLTDAGLIEQAS